MGVIAPQYSQDATVMYGRPKMASGVTEGWSHDDGRGGRSVTGIRGHKTNMQLGAWKCNKWTQKFIGGWTIAFQFTTMYCMAFTPGSRFTIIVYSWPLEDNYKMIVISPFVNGL